MATSIESLAARVERLEQLFEGGEMAGPSASKRIDPDVQRFWARIPFSAWLKISGPTFAVMALGFGALWNAQQATTQQILPYAKRNPELSSPGVWYWSALPRIRNFLRPSGLLLLCDKLYNPASPRRQHNDHGKILSKDYL